MLDSCSEPLTRFVQQRRDLAEQSGISVPTIQRLDSTKGPLSGRYETIEAVRLTFAKAGIQFLENGKVSQSMGVALKVAERDAYA